MRNKYKIPVFASIRYRIILPHILKRISISFCLLLAISFEWLSAQEHKLWYDRPAQVWTEALPLGNGRLGAMVFGNPAVEQLQLNEETLWAGRPNNNANPEGLKYIPKVRELVFAGKYLEAQTLATEKVMSKTNPVCLIKVSEICVFRFPGIHGIGIIIGS